MEETCEQSHVKSTISIPKIKSSLLLKIFRKLLMISI